MDDFPADPQLAPLFTRADGSFRFARWARNPAPIVFGTDDASLVPIRAGMEEAALHAGLTLADADPELGASLIVFFCQRWEELSEVPHLERLLPGLPALIARLEAADANQYRLFRFDPAGAIRATTLLLRQDESLSGVPAHTLMLSQTVQSLLLWSETAFAESGPIDIDPNGIASVKPRVAQILHAAYDRTLPDVSEDPSLTLRLAARMRRTT